MKLNKKDVTPFLSEHVLLTFDTNFRLEGYIDDIFEDGVLFRTNQKTSLISFDAIKIIVPINRRDAT